MTVPDALLDRTREVLTRHPVSFAMVFGSTTREAAEPRDLDLAVEFEDGIRSEGYSEAYLQLLIDLEAALDIDVDIVRVSSMSPEFARVAFDEGVVVLGSEARKDELARRHAGELPSVAEARDRIAAVAERLTRETG